LVIRWVSSAASTTAAAIAERRGGRYLATLYTAVPRLTKIGP
jgi:hypothetical protein